MPPVGVEEGCEDVLLLPLVLLVLDDVGDVVAEVEVDEGAEPISFLMLSYLENG